MLVILQDGGFKTGGINFDAKTRRNSTDLEDIFYSHISGMDVFARSLIIADAVLKNSEYLSLKEKRYLSFDEGKGKEFEEGKLSLDALRDIAIQVGEPQKISGKQELIESIINSFI